eukprot:sb/3472697/
MHAHFLSLLNVIVTIKPHHLPNHFLQDYLTTTSAAQEKLALNQDPVLKLSDLISKKTALERDLYYLVRKPIPQWYKEKLKKMMDAMKNNGTKTEGEKVTNDDTVVEGEETKKGEEGKTKKGEEGETKKEEKKEEEEPKKEEREKSDEIPVKTEGDESKKEEL